MGNLLRQAQRFDPVRGDTAHRARLRKRRGADYG